MVFDKRRLLWQRNRVKSNIFRCSKHIADQLDIVVYFYDCDLDAYIQEFLQRYGKRYRIREEDYNTLKYCTILNLPSSFFRLIVTDKSQENFMYAFCSRDPAAYWLHLCGELMIRDGEPTKLTASIKKSAAELFLIAKRFNGIPVVIASRESELQQEVV